MDPEKRGLSNASKRNNLENIFIAITAVLGIILIINIVLTYSLKNDLQKSAEAVKEKLKPARIELVVVQNSKCSDCFDISGIVSHIKSANANVTRQSAFEFDSKEGKEIIKKYNIAKVPAVVLTGEVDKLNIQGMEKKENALLLAKLDPPYTNAATGKIEGRVTLLSLADPQCAKCSDINILISQIKASGIKVSEQKNIAPESDDGKELIKKYGIGFAPTIIMSKEASAYDIMQKAWPKIGSKETDGSYVLRLEIPPFINLTTGKMKGLVNIFYLTDKSCAECYDVNQHREILTSPQGIFNVKLEKEETYDIGDAKGKELAARYNITQVPTVILSDEIDAYPSSQALKQFFSIEKDSFYVFRALSAVGTYRDLATNQIVKPPQQSQRQ